MFDIVVAICTYNNARMLKAALESLERQQTKADVRWGVVVVDNNSTDETSTVVEHWRKHGCLSHLDLVHEPRQGLAHARRRAVAATNAQLIAFVDDDCVLATDWVQEAVVFFRDHERAGVVGGRVQVVWEHPPEQWLMGFARSFAEQDHGLQILRLPDRGVIRLVGAGLVCRRTALEDSGWLAGGALLDRKGSELTAGGDIEIVLRVRYAGYEAWYTPALHLQHVIPRRRMSKEYVRRLHRGFGRAMVALYFIETCKSPTTTRVLRALGYAARELAMTMAATVVRRREKLIGVQQSVAVSEAFGKLEGAWRLLWTDREQVSGVVAELTADKRN
jgi:glycosyltransferase involved in cell wall biosynthesis